MPIKCPDCRVDLIKDVDSWLCPDCNGRWHRDTSKDVNDMGVIWHLEQQYKRSITILGGGSKNGGKKEKKGNKVFTDPWSSV